MALDAIPFVGTVKGIQEVLTGVDLITGQQLSVADRVAEGAGVLLSVLPEGKLWGTLAAKEAIDGGAWVWKQVGKEAVEETEMQGNQFTNGIRNIQTGGRNNLSVDEYFRREAEASKMYDSIRASTSDVQAISKNTGITESRIQRIKDHVFNNAHIKSSGNGRFDPDYEIAQAWTRLQQGTYNAKDIDLLNHELFESRFEGIFKTDYETAHDAAVRSGRPWEID
nr:pre-toxin TG domain-containing protein [Paenibacillus sp. SGZ-1014]